MVIAGQIAAKVNCVMVSILISACGVVFQAFVVVCCCCFKNQLFPKIFQEHYQSAKQFVSRLEPKCLHLGCQQTTKVATSKEIVKYDIALLMDSSSLILFLSFYNVTNTVCKIEDLT